MTSLRQKTLARISRMDWDEIRTRVEQEVYRRADLLRHRLAGRPKAIRLREPAGATGNFFFAGVEAEKRAELLHQHLPGQAAQIVQEADEICQHRFRLLGYENLDYGAEIDWHLDRVHNKRAPLDPWFKIPFLEFALVGDHKVTWELNRHQHLVTLAKASVLTKDDKYVRELITQWRSWQKANPYPLGINWGSTLEVAFRSLSWIWVDQLMGGGAQESQSDKQTPAKFRAELLPALAFHGRYIERYLSTYFSPNTHLLGEALALFFLGTLYPQMPHAQRWKDKGWRILLHEAGRQVRPDGVYFEQSLYYHVYALDFFLYARMLAAANGISIPAEYDQVLNRMLDVVQALAQAGPAEGFGDDDGGRLFNPRRNRAEDMTDPLAVGALVFNRDNLSAAQLTEESIWLFGEGAVRKLESATANTATTKHTASSVAFPDGGLYVIADGLADASNSAGNPQPSSQVMTQVKTQVMTIDAGPQGVDRCGHGHADALSLRISIAGERWLVDSGSGVYIASDPADRDVFRGTSAHNTMRVDGLDQAVADEPFSWKQIATTRADSWVTGKTFTYFAGSHDGYARLADPVTHRRFVLRVNNGVWLVRDVAVGNAEHDLELRWHFASDISVQETAAGEWIALRPDKRGLALRIVIPEETAWKAQVTRGLISPAYGRYQSAPVVRCEARVKLPTEIATALIAEKRAAQTGDRARMVSMPHAAVQVYELHDGNQSHGFFFNRDVVADQGRPNQPWSFGPWSSDAQMLYCRIEDEKLAQLIIIGASSVAWQGQLLLAAQGASEFFEWRRCDRTINTSQNPMRATSLFDQLTGNAQSLSSSESPSESHASDATSSYAEKH